MFPRSLHQIVIALGLGMLCLPGCARRDTTVARGNRAGILHVGNGAEVQSLDPHLAGGSVDFRLGQQLQAVAEVLVEEIDRARAGPEFFQAAGIVGSVFQPVGVLLKSGHDHADQLGNQRVVVDQKDFRRTVHEGNGADSGPPSEFLECEDQ
ncbi:MAG: hypothetical protein EXS38_05840 [Opitutus sp.]|nr:hypothetical protein [Opitutus sp.]